MSLRMKTFLISILTLCGASMYIPGGKAAPSSQGLNAEAPIEVSAASERFDLMAVDSARHRLLAAHSQAGTLTVVDLVDHQLLGEIPVGKSSGVAIDAPDGKYFVGTTQGVAVVDPDTLKKTDFISTPGPTDAMVFDADNKNLYVGHDDGKELWVIDARHDKITGRIAIPDAPELMEIDPRSHRLYVNIKPLNEVIAIDLGSGKNVAHWSTLPTDSPHGLALDIRDQRMFIAGRSRMVSVFSLPAGTPQKAIDIGPGRVDQIAFDARARQLYCPSSGRLVIIKVSALSDAVLGSVAIPQGTHSVAVDPDTHWVWIAYADNDHSYVQAFSPVATAEAAAFKGQELAGEAKIGMEQARAIALQAYPGKITDEELEKEKGGSGLRYSFDIKKHKVTHEVGVDAETGKLLENDREGPNVD
jgi:DNA-binding beta-propeller fold protein YncE